MRGGRHDPSASVTTAAAEKPGDFRSDAARRDIFGQTVSCLPTSELGRGRRKFGLPARRFDALDNRGPCSRPSQSR